jgi:hypothetical protein
MIDSKFTATNTYSECSSSRKTYIRQCTIKNGVSSKQEHYRIQRSSLRKLALAREAELTLDQSLAS